MIVCLALLTLGPTTSAVAELRFQVNSRNTMPGHQALKRVTEPVKAPAGLKAQTVYRFTFGGQPRLAMLATQNGRRVALVDTNGNGSLQDEVPHAMQQTYNQWNTQAIILRRWIDGKLVVAPYTINSYAPLRGSARPTVTLSPLGVYTGEIEIGGTPTRIEVGDSRADGSYHGTYGLRVTHGGESMHMQSGDGIAVEGRFYRFVVSPLGDTVAVESEVVKTRPVTFAAETVSLLLAAGERSYHIRSSNGTIPLPEGEMRIRSLSVTRRDEQGRTWAMGLHATKAEGVPVDAGSNALSLEPLALSLAHRERLGVHTFDFRAKVGEHFQVTSLAVDGANPEEPVLRLLDAKSRVVEVKKFHYG
jgi:hypothetical protein